MDWEQRDDMMELLKTHTEGHRDDDGRVCRAIASILEESALQSLAQGPVHLRDADIVAAQRAALFREMARIMCGADVTDFTRSPTEVTWTAPGAGKRFCFFARSARWHLKVVDTSQAQDDDTDSVSPQQEEEIREALLKYTIYTKRSDNDIRSMAAIVEGVEKAIASPYSAQSIGLNDSHVKAAGQGAPYRELLFKELARILCGRDVNEWATMHSGKPTESYQDAAHMEFAWVSWETGKAYKLYTYSPPPRPGFSVTIDWRMLVTRAPPQKAITSGRPDCTACAGKARGEACSEERIREALVKYTFYTQGDPNSELSMKRVVKSITAALASAAGPQQARNIHLDDSHIKGAGKGQPHREHLFLELAHIMCGEDVTAWAKRQSGTPTRSYQDYMEMEFTWESKKTRKAFKFFTMSSAPAEGFSVIIDWYLLITDIAPADPHPTVAALHTLFTRRIRALEMRRAHKESR